MGCSSQKAVEIEEVKKDEIKLENEEAFLDKKEEGLEEVVLEKPNEDLDQKEEEEEPKQQTIQPEIAVEEETVEEKEPEEKEVEEEKKSEEIPEDINIDEEDIEFKSLNNNSKSLQKKSYELENLNNNLKSKKNINSNKNRNKNKKNINKKKPFSILENQLEPYQKVKIGINACSFVDEYMMPIWCPENVYIKFRVEGKWRIDKIYEYTDSKGMPSNHSSGFNYGALIGRIGLGEKFVVVDETAILVKKEGPLFLRQNLPKNMKIEPEGKLEISVYDGIYMKIEEINEKIGWKEHGAIDNSNENQNNEKNNIDKKSMKSSYSTKIIDMEEKELEKNLRKQLNNLRMNPTLFYEKYINFNTNLIKTKKYLDKIEKEEKMPLDENISCYNFLEDYFKLPNQIQFKKTINKNNLSESLLKLEEDIAYFLLDQIGKTVKTKCKMTQKDNPNDIILQFLLDKKFRTYIFRSQSQILTIKIFKNYFIKSTLVIMAIALVKDYTQEEEEI